MPVWSASPHQLQHGIPETRLSRPWQLLILSDGSNTRNLELLTGSEVQAHVIRSGLIDLGLEAAPEEIHYLEAPIIRRQVWLTTASSQIPLLYATSWWPQEQIHQHLPDPAQPIGRSLARSRLGLFRDLRGLYLGRSDLLAELLHHPGPFWGRHYLLWHQQQPMTLIYEVFSPHLATFLEGSPS